MVREEAFLLARGSVGGVVEANGLGEIALEEFRHPGADGSDGRALVVFDGGDGLADLRAVAELGLGLRQDVFDVVVGFLATPRFLGALGVEQQTAHDGADLQEIVAHVLGDEVAVVGLVLGGGHFFLHADEERAAEDRQGDQEGDG